MPKNPEVTVVIPTRDRRAIAPRAVRCALGQHDVRLEVIVIDDGSTDGTAAAVEELADPRLRVVRHERPRGVANARNRGIELAEGEWVALLDDDDLWAPAKVRHQLDTASAALVDFVYADVVAVDHRGNPIEWMPSPSPHHLRERIRAENLLPAGASNVLIRVDLVQRAGGFDERLVHLADWDLWIRLAGLSAPARCAETLVAYVVHEGNMHATDTASALAEGRYLKRKHRDADLPGTFDEHRFLDWVAMGHGRAGRHARAAALYARLAAAHASRTDARRAVGQALRALRLRRPPPHAAGSKPDWLAGTIDDSAANAPPS